MSWLVSTVRYSLHVKCFCSSPPRRVSAPQRTADPEYPTASQMVKYSVRVKYSFWSLTSLGNQRAADPDYAYNEAFFDQVLQKSPTPPAKEPCDAEKRALYRNKRALHPAQKSPASATKEPRATHRRALHPPQKSHTSPTRNPYISSKRIPLTLAGLAWSWPSRLSSPETPSPRT